MNSMKKSLKRYWQMYLLLILPIIYIVVFKYVPMLGLQIAFKDFSLRKGIWKSAWVGLEHFQRFFSSSRSWDIIWNTLCLGVLTLVCCFPMPIILALIFNEIRSKRFMKTLQTVTYAPHFISTIVVCGMVVSMLAPSTGIVNTLLIKLGVLDEPFYFMGSAAAFRPIYIISEIWKDSGWGAIMYVSALAAIDQSLYEAAEVDGASRWKQLLHITLPGIMPTIIIMLILETGKVLNIGYEKVYALQNDLNLATSEVISTFTYKQGIESLEYDYSTAIGMLNSVVSFILLITVNNISKKFSKNSLF